MRAVRLPAYRQTALDGSVCLDGPGVSQVTAQNPLPKRQRYAQRCHGARPADQPLAGAFVNRVLQCQTAAHVGSTFPL